MSEWNDAIAAAKNALPTHAAALDRLVRPDSGDCLHPELTFDNGDYLIICHTCGNRWAMVAQGRESGIDRNGQLVGGDVSLARKGAAAGLSGHRRVKPT